MDKKAIAEEIENEINASYRSKNLRQLIDILLSVITLKTGEKDLAGIEERMYVSLGKIFDEDTSVSDIKLCLSNVVRIEPLLKKILFLVNEGEYDNVVQKNLGLAHVIGVLGLNPEHKKLDVEPETYDISNELNIEEYLKGIAQQLKQRMSRFIHIRGEENFAVLGSYVIEYQDDSLDSKRRKGTVEYLRDNSIPERRMMIWGEAGLGKTTTLEYLTYIDAKKRLKDTNCNIPILISLGVLTDSKYTIKQYICDKLDISIDMCETLLDDGKINLFLDGVNEIPSDTGGILKTVRMREIKQLIKDYPKTFMIITNRPQDTRDFNNVPIFNLMKLSRDEMEEFIKKNVDEEDVKSMMFNSIRGNERFVQIINTPLILSRLIEIVRYKKEIPHSEGEIIAEFLNCLLLREKEEKQDARLDIKRLTYLLRMIAFESLENKEANSGMTESEIIKYCVKAMDTYKFEYDTLYALDIMLQLGILEKRENMYVFSHQAYQDHYYAMEELAVIQS